ncbi:MAG: asparagine synthase (glutamine-hydrolyzing) [Geminicoccaceae bacterium]
MCGLLAIISPAVPIREDLLVVMRDRMIHRGPDAGKNWLHPNHRAAFAHRRLSIIDPSAASDQPMSNEGSVIVFNGAIYNYIELRDELEQAGIVFKTRGDTEVLLEALRYWGEDALLKLNGMFAFAYWDERRNAMLIARDRFGEKPLFIGHGAFGTTIVASEMKAILPHPLISGAKSAEAIDRFGTGTWYEHDELTFFEDIKRLPAAHAVWIDASGKEMRRWRYWTPDYTDIDHGLDIRDAVDGFRQHMETSVRLRLRADVPIGSSLSGGLDSSLIVGLLAEERRQSSFEQKTFSACFPSDPTISEHDEIAVVVKHARVGSYQVVPEAKHLEREMRSLHWHQEEPFLSASIYLQWCVARLAESQGTTVLLDGQGADELLGGYQFYFKQRQLDLLDRGELDLAHRETVKFNRRLDSVHRGYRDADRRFNAKVAYQADELKGLEQNPEPLPSSAYGAGVAPAISGFRFRKMMSEALLYNTLPALLRYADRNSMAFAREARLPFLDYELVNFCLRLPDHFLIRHGWQKWVLRMCAGRLLPRTIRWRADKVGYAAPLDNWMRAEIKPWALDRVMSRDLAGLPGYDRPGLERLWQDHQEGGANHSWALWRWISLGEWLDMHAGGTWTTGMISSNRRAA